MNERIKELYEQSLEEKFQYGGAGAKPGEMYSNYVYVLNAEKFAMLLIRETLIAAHAGVEFGPSMEEAVEAYFGIKL